MPQANVDIVGSIAKLQSELSKMAGATDKAAFAAAVKLSTRMEAGQEQAAKSAVKAGKQSAAAWAATGAKLEGLGKIVGGIAPQFAPMVEHAAKVGRGLGAFGTSAVAIGGTVAAIGGGLALAGVGMVKLVAKAADFARELAPFKTTGIISADSISRLKEADVAMGAVTTTAKAGVVALGAELAPAIERASVDLIALGLYGAEALGGIEGAAKSAAIWIGGHLVKALLGPVTMLETVAKGAALVARATGQDGIAASIEEMTAAYDRWAQEKAEVAFRFWGDAIEDTERKGSKYIARAREIVDVQGKIASKSKASKSEVEDETRALQEQARAVEQLRGIRAAATDDMLSDEQRIDERLRSQLRTLEELRRAMLRRGEDASEVATAIAEVEARAERERSELWGRRLREELDAQDRLEARVKERADKERAMAEEQLRREQQLTEARISFAGMTASTLEQAAEAVESRAKDGAKGAAAAARALALFQIGLNSYQAVSATVASLGLVGIPAGLLTGAFVAAQLSAAAALQPSFFRGSDEPLRASQQVAGGIPTTQHAGEMTVSAQAVRRYGPETVRAMNRGDQLQPRVDVLVVDRQVLGASVGRSVRSGGRLAEQITSRTGRLGRESYGY